jgi:hypothetical protein
MNAINPLECVKRLEAAGIARPHAEAIAAEINAARNDLASKLYREQLEAALDRTAIRLCIFTVAFTSLACAVLGVVLSS